MSEEKKQHEEEQNYGLDIWKIKYEHIYDHITDKEYDFLMSASIEQDDGNYYIDKKLFSEVVREITMEEQQEIQNLLDALEAEFMKERFEGFTFNLG